MKKSLSIIAIAVVLTACSNTGLKAPVSEQKLATSFVSEKIKIETKCDWFGMGNDCKIVAIESVGTAPANGGTTMNRKTALIRAEMNAKSNVAMFLNDQVSTTRVQTTIAKNIEKAKDRVNSGKDDGTTVEMTDQEAKNISLRENTNDTAIHLTETVRTSASAILRGFRKIDERVIGDQEVAVTVRWDLQSNNSRKQLLQLMQ